MKHFQLQNWMIATVTIIIATPLISQAAPSYRLKTPFDNFHLKPGPALGNYLLNKETVSSRPLAGFLPLFSSTLKESCPKLPSKYDLEIQELHNKQTKVRRFYVRQKIVSDGKKCANIDGDGMYSLPLHRVWFTAKKDFTIPIDDYISIQAHKQKKLEFRKTKYGWRNSNPELMTRWEYFDEVLMKLKNIRVGHRYHLLMAQGKNKFTLNNGQKKYRFYKIKNNEWAVRLPKSKWLIASKDFYHFKHMSLDQWKDRKHESLYLLSNPNADLKQRKETLKTINKYWNKTTKLVLQDILLDATDSDEIKLTVLPYLKQHPSDDTMLVLAGALSLTTNRDLLDQLTQVLQVRNPKGPRINSDKEPMDDAKKIRFWQKWVQKFTK